MGSMYLIIVKFQTFFFLKIGKDVKASRIWCGK